MTNVKITELTVITPVEETDILPVVSDPSGTPVTKKTTVKTLLDTRLNYSIVPAGGFSLGTGTSVQSAFPTAGDVFTLEALTTYEFEGMYLITKSGTTCTIGLAFALAGGATITSILYNAIAQSVAANTTGTTQDSAYVTQVAATVINATSSTNVWIKFKGLIRMNAGGTVTPQIIFSAAPTTPVMAADSYIKFTPIGTNTENTKGVVA
jgi:hypothetical protein